MHGGNMMSREGIKNEEQRDCRRKGRPKDKNEERQPLLDGLKFEGIQAAVE